MANTPLTTEQTILVKAAVKANPAAFYKRLQSLYPQEAPKFGKGYETTDSSVSSMIRFLTTKAEASGNPLQYLQNL